MAHLLDPGRDDDHGYRLSALVPEYLNQDYPYMGEDLFAKDYPEFLRRCLEKDAELVFRLAEALASQDGFGPAPALSGSRTSSLIGPCADAPRWYRRRSGRLCGIPRSRPATA